MAKKKAKKTFRKSVKKTIAKPAKKSVAKKTGKPTQAIAIVALILNIIILPGLGSLIGGKTKEGIWQLVLAIIGVLLSIIVIGIPILLAAWIWGIMTGVKLIQNAQ